MRLSDLLNNTKTIKIEGDADLDIKDIAYDSRNVTPGSLFVAIPGEIFDGTRFIPMAVEKGAIAIIAEKDFQIEGKAVKVIVSSSRSALADSSIAFFKNPTKDLIVTGITGTNGKTTTAFMLDSILHNTGNKTGLVGTIEMKIGDEVFPSRLTTPESYDLQKYFAQCVQHGVTHVVMEVSSHSLAMKRVKGVEFDRAIYTNLTHDHLDFHKTLESYLDTKLNLFRMLGNSDKKAKAIINIDDDYSEAVIEESPAEYFTYSMRSKAMMSGKILSVTEKKMEMEIKHKAGSVIIGSSLIGEYNAYNILAAAAAASTLGISLTGIKTGIESLSSVPGRFERIECGQDYKVIVDYAHTPDGLEKLLSAVSRIKKGRTILVFGCTGNRDKLKRPIMGKIAAKSADFVILSSDDPHSEDQDQINREVESGMLSAGARPGDTYVIISDREKAIQKSIEMASRDDIVVIAGRGHEKFQDHKGRKVAIDDRDVASKAISRRSG